MPPPRSRPLQLVDEARAEASPHHRSPPRGRRARSCAAAQRAKEGLRDQVAHLAVAGAEKILRREVNPRPREPALPNLKQELQESWPRTSPSRAPYADAAFELAPGRCAGALVGSAGWLATVAANSDMQACFNDPNPVRGICQLVLVVVAATDAEQPISSAFPWKANVCRCFRRSVTCSLSQERTRRRPGGANSIRLPARRRNR